MSIAAAREAGRLLLVTVGRFHAAFDLRDVLGVCAVERADGGSARARFARASIPAYAADEWFGESCASPTMGAVVNGPQGPVALEVDAVLETVEESSCLRLALPPGLSLLPASRFLGYVEAEGVGAFLMDGPALARLLAGRQP